MGIINGSDGMKINSRGQPLGPWLPGGVVNTLIV